MRVGNRPMAIEMLMNEHRVIEKVLGALESFAKKIHDATSAEAGERRELQDFVDFFRNFADRCHHAKEEDRLFVRMEDYGFSKLGGPLAVMLADHDEGRSHVKALAAVAGGTGPLSDDERDEIFEHARSFSSLLRAHIQKEDQVLYPMAQQVLPEKQLEGLKAEFDQFEENVMGAGEHERFHKLAETLITAYPHAAGDAEEDESPEGCFFCPGHG